VLWIVTVDVFVNFIGVSSSWIRLPKIDAVKVLLKLHAPAINDPEIVPKLLVPEKENVPKKKTYRVPIQLPRSRWGPGEVAVPHSGQRSRLARTACRRRRGGGKGDAETGGRGDGGTWVWASMTKLRKPAAFDLPPMLGV
jgi:hypothetical protein